MRAKCGINAYLRPCQLETVDANSGIFPWHPVCQSASERVIICDDDDAISAELGELVAGLGFAPLFCNSLAELQRVAPSVSGGCVLLDIRMPGQDGLMAQEWLTQHASRLPVVFVSAVIDVSTVATVMRAGALNFLPKPVEVIALRRVITEAIAASRKLVCEEAGRKLLVAMVDLLTPTERFVADLIARGYPTKSIAAEMERSENTIKIHRHRIFNKLRVGTAASVANIMNIIKN